MGKLQDIHLVHVSIIQIGEVGWGSMYKKETNPYNNAAAT